MLGLIMPYSAKLCDPLLAPIALDTAQIEPIHVA